MNFKTSSIEESYKQRWKCNDMHHYNVSLTMRLTRILHVWCQWNQIVFFQNRSN